MPPAHGNIHMDDLRIPAVATGPDGRAPISSSYRARRPGGDPGMRAMTIGAVALGGVLLAGIGGWALMGRRPAAVPVIEADSRPLRIKPENAGGMQVAGADEQVLGGQSGGADRMAPAPEAPAPQALRAQMQQTPGPAAAPPASAPAPTAAPAPGVSPLPDTPLRQMQAARPTPAIPATPPAVPPAAPVPATQPAPRPAPAGATLVQLAAVGSEAAAQAEWQRLAKRMPELLAERRPVVQKAERDGQPVWRVRTGGFGDIAEATGFCTKVKARGGNCAIASF